METPNNKDEEAIRALVKNWMKATKCGDINTVLSLMTDDVVFLVPGQQPFGKVAFKNASEKMSKGENQVQFEGFSDIEEIKIIGDWAFTRSHLKVNTISSANSEPIRRSGYTMTIFKKEIDGQWRIARDANLLTVEK